MTDTRFSFQPDGYLTAERKAADPDHGFSTFFSETGMCILLQDDLQSTIRDHL